MSEQLRKDLSDELKEGNVVVIVGAGVSIAATNGASVASWVGLLSDGVRYCVDVTGALEQWANRRRGQIDSGDTDELISAADLIEKQLGGRKSGEFARWLKASIGTLPINDNALLKGIGDLGAPIVTTNYDNLIEQETGLESITWSESRKLDEFVRDKRQAVVHIHGHFDEPESVILGVRSYEAILGDMQAQSALRTLLSTRTLVWIGIGVEGGLSDPNFGALRDWIAEIHSTSTHRHYVLVKDDEVEAARKLLPLEGRIFPIGYGENHSDLAPFIKQLAQGSDGQPDSTSMDINTSPDGRWHLPYLQNPFFTGRDEILDDLHATLSDGGTAALTQTQAISGLGGIGKTQIAIEYAYRHREDYDAVLWVRAESEESITSSYVEISGVLGLPEKDAQQQAVVIAAVMRWLAENRDWLIVFDNADMPNLISGFLPNSENGAILLTSRAQVFDMIGIAKPLSLDTMTPNEAKAFLLKRTGRDDLDSQEMKAVEQLAEELDHLPLALEQAGAYIHANQSRFSDYLRSYQNRGLELLERMKVVASKYPQSVMTTWAFNFEQVQQESLASADLLRVSALLSPDNIPLEIITEGSQHLGDNLSDALGDNDALILDEILEPLTRYSLIRRHLDAQTFSIHRLVGAVLIDGMDTTTHKQWAQRAILAVNAAFPSSPDFSNWQTLERLLAHARKCAVLIEAWGFEFEDAARLLNQTAYYLKQRAQYDEAEPLYKRAIEIGEKTLGEQHPDVATRYNNLAALYYAQGELEDALPLYKRALAISQKALPDDHPAIAQSLNNLAALYYAQGKYDQADRLYQQAIAIRQKALPDDHPDIAQSLNNLAELYRAQGELEDALPLYKRALAISQKAYGDDHPTVGIRLNNLAYLYQAQGKHDQAEPLYQQAIAILEATLGNDHPNTVTGRNNYAIFCRERQR